MATSLSAPNASECDAGRVNVTGLRWFRDSKGAWRVVGVISNHSNNAISKVITGVETMTRNGEPADQGEDVSAYPLNLRPGEQSPFIARIDREIPGLDHFVVEVDGCVPAEPAERGRVEVRAEQMTIDGSGFVHLTAELHNPVNQPVLVNGLTAAVYDRLGNLIGADYASVTVRYLGPGESGPVRALIELPAGEADLIKSYRFFMDVLVTPSVSIPVDVQKDVHVISTYTDEAGHFHLLGTLNNSSAGWLMTSLQASVYADQTRKVLVDAASMNTWIPLGPGQSLPFDLTGWGALDHTTGLWKGLVANQAVIDMRFEPFLTWTRPARIENLTLVKKDLSFETHRVSMEGRLRNETGRSLNNGVVIVQLLEKANNDLIAVGNSPLAILDSLQAGQEIDFSLSIPLPLDVDPLNLTVEVTAWGQIP